MKRFLLLPAVLCALVAVPAHARLITRDVPYVQDGVQLEGYLAYDDAYPVTASGRAGVLIAHEWWGLNDYVRTRAHQLAGLGYVAFALDMYGKGIYTTHATTAANLAKPFYGSPVMAERARAGLDELIKTGLVDPKRIAAIGYCFGGTAVLSLAFSGAPVRAVVCFHGGLIPAPADAARTVHARFLICHGAIDPFVPRKQVDAFLDSMNRQKLDFEFVEYSGAVHAFTNPDADELAGTNGLTGIRYSPEADRRSWMAMKALFAEVLGQN
jgi:dienelactone hydrolase